MIRPSDRRKHKRLNASIPVHFKVKATNKFGNTLICDISGGGIRVMLENFVPLNTDFVVEFTITDLFQIITAVGRVVWTKKMPHCERYQLGLEFKEILTRNQDTINQFIANKLNSLNPA